MPPASVPRIALTDGRSMPQLGLGTYHPGGEDAREVIRTALAVGYEAVDTAAIYGNEEAVGAALDGRDDVFLTTKLWNADQGYDKTLRAFDASLQRLRREVIDLYLIHWPAPKNGSYVASWQALVRLRQEGRVKSIGVSNFGIEPLQHIIDETGEVPSVNQVELHPLFQQRELRAFHAQHGIATESWSPLAQGKLLSEAMLLAIAARHGKTVAQVVIRWHMDSGLIAIPKSVKRERLLENISVFDFVLHEEDMQAIATLDAVDGRIGPDPANARF